VLQGIIGDTYERFTVGQEAFNPNSTYYLPEDVSGHLLTPCASAGMFKGFDSMHDSVYDLPACMDACK
jgi:hypothetical protein